jgi:hypothetical protein
MLRFDYVSTNKPRKGTPILNDARFDKFIQNLKLIDIKRVWDKMTLKRQAFRDSYQKEYGDLKNIRDDLSFDEFSRASSPSAIQSSILTPQFIINPVEYPELSIDLPLTVKS